MPRKKKDTELQELVATLFTVQEASEWSEAHKEEFGLSSGLNTETVKKACQHGRLKAVLKGRNFLTREQELRAYLQTFDPKNKREERPLKPRALKKRAKSNLNEALTADTHQPSAVS